MKVVDECIGINGSVCGCNDGRKSGESEQDCGCNGRI